MLEFDGSVDTGSVHKLRIDLVVSPNDSERVKQLLEKYSHSHSAALQRMQVIVQELIAGDFE